MSLPLGPLAVVLLLLCTFLAEFAGFMLVDALGWPLCVSDRLILGLVSGLVIGDIAGRPPRRSTPLGVSDDPTS